MEIIGTDSADSAMIYNRNFASKSRSAQQTKPNKYLMSLIEARATRTRHHPVTDWPN
jgi:hypothetical protein